ncbi:hypothetical protein [Clostridium lundense]|uniref:hypothetical protein n=1 Tax=Clostridium lundense TaxID=319475 RepID=UPI00047F8E93|nr:hypothetical protein [Clostridium lundense]
MNKEKKLKIFLVILIFLLINYVTYRCFFFSRYNNLLAQKEEFTQKEDKIKKLKLTEKKIKEIKKENEKLKKDIELMNKLTSNQIDTPQLIYDFYYSCIKYGINGEEMKFDLFTLDNKYEKDGKDEKQEKNKAEDKNKKSVNSSKEKDNSSEINYISDDIVRLSLTLKVSGNKYKIEKYINNLNGITERKLNVKSVRLFSKIEEESKREDELIINNNLENKEDINFNNGGNKDKEDFEENNNSLKKDSFILVKDEVISCEIVFYQYIRVSEENYDSIKNYSFYNKKIGFRSIGDMFGSKKRSR